jgi:hypothetical protein
MQATRGAAAECDFFPLKHCIVLEQEGMTAKLHGVSIILMNPLLLKTLHIAGVITLFASLGATLLAGSGKKSASILHGVSLAFILLIGFAMLKKPPMDESWWMIKLVLWLFLGVAPLLVKKKLLPPWMAFTLSVGAAVLATWLGLMKSAAF